MLTFKAQRISPIFIHKLGKDNKYHKYEANLVKLNPSVRADVRCIEDVNKAWEDGNSLVDDVAKNMRDEFVNGKTEDESRYYAITTQNKNYSKMNPGEILGVSEVLTTEEENVDYIDAIQVAPMYTRDNLGRTFRGIGNAILNSIKALAPTKDFILEARSSALSFYEKNGFKAIGNSGFMIFKR